MAEKPHRVERWVQGMLIGRFEECRVDERPSREEAAVCLQGVVYGHASLRFMFLFVCAHRWQLHARYPATYAAVRCSSPLACTQFQRYEHFERKLMTPHLQACAQHSHTRSQ